MKRILIALVTTVILLGNVPTSVEAASLRWYSCTIAYSIKAHGYSLAAFDVAVHDIEKATGLEFEKVPWDRADMKITIGGKGEDVEEDLGRTKYWYSGRIQNAKIYIYRLTYQANWITRMNTFRHELGHALGLNHVKAKDIMNKYVDDSLSKTQWKSKLKKRYKECS